MVERLGTLLWWPTWLSSWLALSLSCSIASRHHGRGLLIWAPLHLIAEVKGGLPALQALVAARADVALQRNPHGKFSDALFRAAGTAQYEASQKAKPAKKPRRRPDSMETFLRKSPSLAVVSIHVKGRLRLSASHRIPARSTGPQPACPQPASQRRSSEEDAARRPEDEGIWCLKQEILRKPPDEPRAKKPPPLMYFVDGVAQDLNKAAEHMHESSFFVIVT